MRSIPSLDKGVSHFRCTLPTPPYTHINNFFLQHDKVDEVVHTTEKSTHLRLFKVVQAKLIPGKLLSDIIIPHRKTINTEILCWMVYPKAQQDGLQLTPGLISNDPEIGTAMTQINVHIYVSSAPSYLAYIKLVKVRCLLMETIVSLCLWQERHTPLPRGASPPE